MKRIVMIAAWLLTACFPLTTSAQSPLLGLSSFDHDEGLLVQGVIKGSPAELAGFKKGDVVLGLDPRALVNSVAQASFGDQFVFSIRRGEEYRTLSGQYFPLSFTTSLDLMDQAPLEITLQSYGAPPRLKPINLPSEFGHYRELALAGNSDAAARLFVMLFPCEGMHIHRNKLGKSMKIVSARQDQGREDPLAYCQTITAKHLEDMDRFAELATETNNLSVLRMYFGRLVHYKKPLSARAFEVTETLWSLGHIDALKQYATLWERGWQDQQPDPVKAFSFRYLSSEMSIARMLNCSGDSPRLKDIVNHMRSATELKGAELSPDQVSAAMHFARNLLTQKASCCYF